MNASNGRRAAEVECEVLAEERTRFAGGCGR
jgi:hypothetical protein